MTPEIWLASFHFVKKYKVKKGKTVVTVVDELISEPFILTNNPDKCKDVTHIQNALRTKGIDRTNKTAYEKWTAEGVKISCKLIKKIDGLSNSKYEYYGNRIK